MVVYHSLFTHTKPAAGPFWREPLLGNYFRLWSALVHTWLKRHCIDDVMQQPVAPVREPRTALPTTHSIPTLPSLATHRPAPAAPLTPQAKRARRVRGMVAAAVAYLVSAYIHEMVFFMTVLQLTWPSFFWALLTLALYVSIERRFGPMLSHSLITMAVFLGHAIMYTQIGVNVISVKFPELVQ